MPISNSSLDEKLAKIEKNFYDVKKLFLETIQIGYPSSYSSAVYRVFKIGCSKDVYKIFKTGCYENDPAKIEDAISKGLNLIYNKYIKRHYSEFEDLLNEIKALKIINDSVLAKKKQKISCLQETLEIYKALLFIFLSESIFENNLDAFKTLLSSVYNIKSQTVLITAVELAFNWSNTEVLDHMLELNNTKEILKDIPLQSNASLEINLLEIAVAKCNRVFFKHLLGLKNNDKYVIKFNSIEDYESLLKTSVEALTRYRAHFLIHILRVIIRRHAKFSISKLEDKFSPEEFKVIREQYNKILQEKIKFFEVKVAEDKGRELSNKISDIKKELDILDRPKKYYKSYKIQAEEQYDKILQEKIKLFEEKIRKDKIRELSSRINHIEIEEQDILDRLRKPYNFYKIK